MTSRSLSLESDEKRLILAASFLVVGLCLTYIYLINLSVFNIYSREQSEDKIGSLRGRVASLEGNYLTLSSRITIDLAHQLGFQDAIVESAFASRDETNVSLAVRLNEI